MNRYTIKIPKNNDERYHGCTHAGSVLQFAMSHFVSVPITCGSTVHGAVSMG